MMPRLIALKLLRLVPVMFLVTFGTFSLLHLTPGDPALDLVGQDSTEEDYLKARANLNLDDPFFSRYFDWLGGAVTGDFGNQLTNPSFTVIERLQRDFPVTLELAVVSIVISLVISIPLGVYAAFHSGRAFDKVTSGGAFSIISVPSVLDGLLLAFFFVFNQNQVRYPFLVLGLAWAAWLLYKWYQRLVDHEEGASGVYYLILAVVVAALTVWIFTAWPSFPRQGFERITSEGIRENFRSVFLPALTLSLTEIAIFMRLLRSDMMATLQEDFILSARAKGLSRRRILFRHALRPSSFSLITLSAVAFGRLIGGTVIIENVFTLPGLGRFLVEKGVQLKDYNVVMGGVILLATVFVLLNTAVDIAYNYLDPRIRRGRR